MVFGKSARKWRLVGYFRRLNDAPPLQIGNRRPNSPCLLQLSFQPLAHEKDRVLEKLKLRSVLLVMMHNMVDHDGPAVLQPPAGAKDFPVSKESPRGDRVRAV